MSTRARRSAAAILFAQAQAFDDEAASEGPELEQDRVHPRRILRREARRLAATAPKPGSRARRRRGLRVLAGTAELLQASAVLMDRVEELTARIDEAYEAAERDEVERESLLEALEAAGHDTMDWSSEEQHDEGQDDYSSDEEDADMDAAADFANTNPAQSALHDERAAILRSLPTAERRRSPADTGRSALTGPRS